MKPFSLLFWKAQQMCTRNTNNRSWASKQSFISHTSQGWLDGHPEYLLKWILKLFLSSVWKDVEAKMKCLLVFKSHWPSVYPRRQAEAWSKTWRRVWQVNLREMLCRRRNLSLEPDPASGKVTDYSWELQSSGRYDKTSKPCANAGLGTQGRKAGSLRTSRNWNGVLEQVTSTACDSMSCSWKAGVHTWKTKSKFTSCTMSPASPFEPTYLLILNRSKTVRRQKKSVWRSRSNS